MAARQPVCIDGQELENGVFLVDKPEGMTSFAIVRKIRWLLGIKKVGHAGTLDPFATGVLVVCVGRTATRCIDTFMTGRKTYHARLQLGIETETQDPEGSITRCLPVPEFDQDTLAACLQQYVGPQMQAPPPYSAAKHNGKPLYTYARQGVFIIKPGKPIEIYSLVCKGYNADTHQLDVMVECSRGTYVRVLAADIGRTLGCGAHLIGLRRTASGPFFVDQCLPGTGLFAEDGLQLLLSGRRSIEEAIEFVSRPSL